MPIAGGGGVVRRSSAAFCSALPVFVSVSFLLLAYRSAVHLAAARIVSVIDRDPDVRSLLSRLSSSSPAAAAAANAHRRPFDHHYHYGHGYPPRHRRRPPFLHHAQVGILDEDFSDVDHADASYPLKHHEGWAANSTSLTSPGRLLHLGGGGRGLGLSGEGKIRVSHHLASPILFFFPENGDGSGDGDRGEQGPGADIEIRIFGQGFNLRRGDAVVLAYLMTLFSVVYFFSMAGFLVCYSCAIGVVFSAVANFLLGRQSPFGKTVSAGSRLGIRRVLAFVFLKWAARDAVAQFLCILLFSDVGNQHSVLKLFVRAKLLPFLLTATPLSQWAPDEEGSLRWFLFIWGVLDRVVDLVLVFSFWVAITDHNERRRGPEVVLKGFRLVSTMMGRAVFLRHVEMMLCWNSGRRVLTAVGGPVTAGVVQSVAEVYFMVVWLTCYFDMKCREGGLNGRTFGRRNLEDCISAL